MSLSLQHVSFEGRPSRMGPSQDGAASAVHPAASSSRLPGARSREDEPAAPGPASARAVDLNSLAGWILSRAGLDAKSYRHSCVERRIPACLRALRAPTPAEARRRLQNEPALLPVAIDALLIGVTAFFRDADVFEGLERHVVPAIVEARERPRPTRGGRGASRPAREARQQAPAVCDAAHKGSAGAAPVRVWSAGCSSGAELFSVGLLLAEAGVRDLELLGTDCRPSAIREAEVAHYDGGDLAHLPPRLAARFEREGARLVPPGELRVRTRWRLADACLAAEDGPWDIVLCRNLSIYLTQEAGRALYGRLGAVVRPGGFLVLGGAERLPQDLPYVGVTRCVYRHVGGGHAGDD